MILADKIMNLRKKNGWSQEELAEKLGVTRQSISKYEGAQAVPDLDKILKLSEIFGVTTDYLIKDEIEEEENVAQTEEEGAAHKVTMEMAHEYLQIVDNSAKRGALAVMLCILSPVCLLLLGAASEVPAYGIGENAAMGIGLCILILMIAVAVAIFILNGMKVKKYEFLEKEDIETTYGVSGMVNDRKDKFHDTYVKNNMLGTVLCICSVVPLFAGIALTEDAFVMVCMVCVLLGLVAAGVYFFVMAGTRMGAMNCLLEEGDYTREKKKVGRKLSALAGGYWLIATAIYLAYSFISNDWDRSWIVWPVAGVLYPVLYAVAASIAVKK